MQDHFDLEPGIHYLNCAYMSPMPKEIREAGYASIDQKARPYTVGVEDFFDPVADVRALFARLINARDPERIAIVPSVSYGMANVAANIGLRRRDKVLILEDQFPSNVYPWLELLHDPEDLVIISKPECGNVSEAWTDRVIDAIDHRTRIVALPHVHWACGTRIDLTPVGKRCREVGALFIIDGTQSIGAMAFDQQQVRADAVVCAGYKWLMGPYGIGAAFYGPWFDDKKPVEHNWINRINSEDFKGLVHYQPVLRPKGMKFSMGEQSNFILIAMFRKALETVLDWGTHRIQSHCDVISGSAIAGLRDAGFDIPGPGQTGNHLFGIGLSKGIDLDALKMAMAEKNLFVSLRGNQVRVSPHLYNTAEDFGVLKEALKQF